MPAAAASLLRNAGGIAAASAAVAAEAVAVPDAGPNPPTHHIDEGAHAARNECQRVGAHCFARVLEYVQTVTLRPAHRTIS